MDKESINWDTDLRKKKDQMKMIHFITQLTRWRILSVLLEQQPSMPLYLEEIAKKIGASTKLVSYQVTKMQYRGWVQSNIEIRNNKLKKSVFLNGRNRNRIIRFYEIIEDVITPRVMLGKQRF